MGIAGRPMSRLALVLKPMCSRISRPMSWIEPLFTCQAVTWIELAALELFAPSLSAPRIFRPFGADRRIDGIREIVLMLPSLPSALSLLWMADDALSMVDLIVSSVPSCWPMNGRDLSVSRLLSAVSSSLCTVCTWVTRFSAYPANRPVSRCRRSSVSIAVRRRKGTRQSRRGRLPRTDDRDRRTARIDISAPPC